MNEPVIPPEPALRVLIVDDDEDDYLITRDLLTDIPGTHFEVTWVTRPNDALAHLESAKSAPDICLLDYRLGRYNGLDLLREAVKRGVTSPIILLTGQEDTDVDREAVQIGASDYLVKGRINAVLLDRAIRYARQQKGTQDALREQTNFVSAILDTAGALVVVLTREGRIARFNRACEETTGYSFEEVKNRRFGDFLIPGDEQEDVRVVFQCLVASQFPNEYENDWLTRSGERRRISWSNTALLDREGEVEYIVSTGIDVTERRRAEAALSLAREREIEVGASIQSTLLVRKPPALIPGLDVGAKTIASQKVGGDYFDFFVFGETCVDVLVGDVMGKGVPAALLAAAAKSHFQGAVRRLGYATAPYGRLPEPEEIVSAVHAVLTPELVDLGSFVTLAYARFHLERREVIFVDCGHPRPILVDGQTGCARTISGENMPLGMSEREVYRQVTIPFAPGDLFFFYSDGLSEACDETDDQFGDERLMRVVTAFRDCMPQEIAEKACEEVNAFCVAADAQSDDLTCVAVRIQDWTAPRRTAFQVREIASDADQLEEARQFILDFCQDKTDSKMDADAQDMLALAANEALANIMKHAYQGRPDGWIQMEIEAFENQVRLRLFDNGKPFINMDRVPLPAFDGSRDNGFGLFLMEQCLDEMHHTRDEMGRNCATLVKKFQER